MLATTILTTLLAQAPALPPAPSPVFKAGVAVVISAAVADVVTTAHSTHPEAYPVMRPFTQSTVAFLAIKAGATAGIVTAANGLRRRGHPKLASGLLWGVASGWAAAAIWNATR